MIKKNVNYVAPRIATMYFEVQNCFASGADISSSKGLSDLNNVNADWD